VSTKKTTGLAPKISGGYKKQVPFSFALHECGWCCPILVTKVSSGRRRKPMVENDVALLMHPSHGQVHEVSPPGGTMTLLLFNL